MPRPSDLPPQTEEDPTSGGYFCGARLRQKSEDGHHFCQMRAGQGTDHVGIGKCSRHGGSTTTHRTRARLQLAELVNPAIVRLAKIVADDDAPTGSQIRAVENILDRAGIERGMAITDSKEMVLARLEELDRAWEQIEDDEDEDG